MPTDPTTRAAAFAGHFYPADPAALRRQIQGCLASPGPVDEGTVGVMVPHAGYRYSGAVAGATLSGLAPPSVIVLLGPKHRREGAPLAISAAAKWATPLGEVAVDQALARALAADVPGLVFDDLAHAREHSLEVQLPLIQTLFPEAQVVPISIGGWLSGERCVALGRRLAILMGSLSPRPLLLASTDMHHQGSDDLLPDQSAAEQAQALSARALERVLALDPAGLVARCEAERITMCGVLPTAVVLAACQAWGATRATAVAVTDSATVAGGSDWVVGYAGVRFTR